MRAPADVVAPPRDAADTSRADRGAGHQPLDRAQRDHLPRRAPRDHQPVAVELIRERGKGVGPYGEDHRQHCGERRSGVREERSRPDRRGDAVVEQHDRDAERPQREHRTDDQTEFARWLVIHVRLSALPRERPARRAAHVRPGGRRRSGPNCSAGVDGRQPLRVRGDAARDCIEVAPLERAADLARAAVADRHAVDLDHRGDVGAVPVMKISSAMYSSSDRSCGARPPARARAARSRARSPV